MECMYVFVNVNTYVSTMYVFMYVSGQGGPSGREEREGIQCENLPIFLLSSFPTLTLLFNCNCNVRETLTQMRTKVVNYVCMYSAYVRFCMYVWCGDCLYLHRRARRRERSNQDQGSELDQGTYDSMRVYIIVCMYLYVCMITYFLTVYAIAGTQLQPREGERWPTSFHR